MTLIPTRVRRAWRELTGKRQADFKGADINRLLLDWIARSLDPDQEIRGSMVKVRARARELARNEGYGKHYLRLLVVNVLGPFGLRMQSRVRKNGALDEETNDAIEAAWTAWGRGKVSIDGRHNLRQFQVIALKALARDGELFVRKWRGFEDNPHGFALQAIDADLLDETFNRPAAGRNNEIRMGVEVDSRSRPVAYWFWERHPAGDIARGGPQKKYRVPADEIIHLYDCDRPNQTRGISWLHASMVPMKMLGGYEEAELVASRTAAAKMGFFEKPEGSGDPTSTEAVDMEASPGVMEELPAGWAFKGWDPQHPVASFIFFVKTVLRKIASGLGVSYESLGNDREAANYSSMRSGLLLERDVWKLLQQDWIDGFLEPVYEEWMNMALLNGILELGSLDYRAYVSAVSWSPRGWQWVDPLKEVQAVGKAIELGLTSRTQEAKERGRDFGETLEELAMEEKMAEAKGVSISGSSSSEIPVQEPDDGEDGGSPSNGNGRGRLATASRF